MSRTIKAAKNSAHHSPGNEFSRDESCRAKQHGKLSKNERKAQRRADREVDYSEIFDLYSEDDLYIMYNPRQEI